MGISFFSPNTRSSVNQSVKTLRSYRDLSRDQLIGPGEYEQPKFIGEQVFWSEKRTEPSYSIGKSDKNLKRHVISKEHVQDLQGLETPGIGKYDSSSLLLKTLSPRATIGKSDRFN